MNTLIQPKPVVNLSDSFPLITDYSMNHTLMIPQLMLQGNYEHTSPDFVKLLELKKLEPYKYTTEKREYEAKFLNTPERYYRTDMILKIISELEGISIFDPVPFVKNPWYSARLEHLLVLGSQMPQEQMEGQIIALGTKIVLGGVCHHAKLDRAFFERGLSLDHNEDVWRMTDRFLIVRPL